VNPYWFQSGSGSGFRDLMTKIVQFLVVEIIFIFIFVDKKMHYMQDVQEQKKPAILKRDHPALQYIKISKFFPFLWAIY
jgi:hypothetical protein